MQESLDYEIVRKMIQLASKLGYRTHVTGTESCTEISQNSGVIFAGNHHSVVDAFFIGIQIPRRIYFLGKRAPLWSNPIWVRLMEYFGTIPVNGRSNKAAIKAGMKVLQKKKALGIFPEGAIKVNRKALEGKTGVARFALGADIPVVPFGILGTEDVLPYGAVWPKPGKRIELNIGQPLYFDEYSHSDATDPISLREVTNQIMNDIRSLSRGYGLPPKYLLELKNQGIL